MASIRRRRRRPGRARGWLAPAGQSLQAQGIDLTGWGEGGLGGHVDITVKHLAPDIETAGQGQAITN
jgi:hypothetical protein